MVDLRGIGELMVGLATLYSAIFVTMTHRNTRTPNGSPTLGRTATTTAVKADEAARLASLLAARLDDTYQRMLLAAKESSAESKALLGFLENVAERRMVPRKEET